jgi:hypothetical protein
MDSTIYFEVFALIDILLGDVLRDYVVRDVAGPAAAIASRPQVASPKLLLLVRKLSEKAVRRTALQPLHQPLSITCGGSELNRCTWSFDTCPFMIETSCCPHALKAVA